MPAKTYYLDAARTETVNVQWGLFFKNTQVRYQDQLLGTFPDQAALKQGATYPLPGGRTLSVQLAGQFQPELAVLVDGQPVPGSATDPLERIRQGWYMAAFLGGLNVLLGLLGALGNIEILAQLGVGWGSLAEGLLYLALGWWGLQSRQPLAFGLLLGLLVLDAIGTLAVAAESGHSYGTGGLVARVFFGLLFYRAFTAARQLKAAGGATPTGGGVVPPAPPVA